MLDGTGSPWLVTRLSFQLTDPLFDCVKTGVGFAAIVAYIVVHCFELQGYVLDGRGKADDSITRFIVALAEAHRTHRSHADGCSSDSRDDLDHDVSLPTYLGRVLACGHGWACCERHCLAGFPWVYPAGVAVVRYRFYCGLPLVVSAWIDSYKAISKRHCCQPRNN